MTDDALGRCTARTKKGNPCRGKAIRGANVCRMHGGAAPQVRAAAARRVAISDIRKEAARLGEMIDVDPIDAILEMVKEAAANVAALRLALAELHIDVRVDGTAIAFPSNIDNRGSRDPALPHVLVVMYDQERDRLVRYSKTALEAGVDERRLLLAEQQAQKLGKVVEAAVRALNPTPEQYQAALQAAAKTLRQLNAGETGEDQQ